MDYCTRPHICSLKHSLQSWITVIIYDDLITSNSMFECKDKLICFGQTSVLTKEELVYVFEERSSPLHSENNSISDMNYLTADNCEKL